MTAPAKAPPAGLPRRLGALFYDSLLLLAVLLAAEAAVVALNGGEAVPPGKLWHQAYLLSVVGGYFGWFWTRAGFTPGMRPWRIRLVRVDGTTPGWREAMLRAGAALVSLAPAGIGFLWAIFDGEHLTWHDRLSGTRVVHDVDDA